MLGIAAAIPPIGFIALLVFVVWSLVLSIIVYMRAGNSETTRAAPAQAT